MLSLAASCNDVKNGLKIRRPLRSWGFAPPAPYLSIFRINHLGELEIVHAQIVPKLCPVCAQLSPHRHRSVRIPYRFPPGWPFIFSAHLSRTSRRTPPRNSQSKGRGWLILTLAGSTVYAFAETLGWRQGLNNRLRQARWFYGLILVSTRVGVGLDFIGINPVKALYLDSCNQRIVSAISTRRNSHCCSGQETHAGPTEFPPGMDSRCDCHNGMFVASVAMFVV